MIYNRCSKCNIVLHNKEYFLDLCKRYRYAADWEYPSEKFNSILEEFMEYTPILLSLKINQDKDNKGEDKCCSRCNQYSSQIYFRAARTMNSKLI